MPDIVVVGAGPTGLACGIELKRRGISAVLIDKGCVVNSLYHYPTHMTFFTTPELLEIGDIPMTSLGEKPVRAEALKYYRKVAAHYELEIRQYEMVNRIAGSDGSFVAQTTDRDGHTHEYAAKKVILATGYYDRPNMLGVPGEDLPKVIHYYKEPHPYYDHDVLVVGAKNSAAIAALELFWTGARVTLSHRGSGISNSVKYWIKPNIENRIKSGEIDVLLRLGDYNGSENDDAVVVALFASNGTAGPTPADDAGPPPRFDGTDTWTVDPDSLLEVDAGADGGVAKFATSDAYVRSNSFVARSSIAYLGLGDLALRIAGATVTGDIDLAAHPYRIHRGRISGRIGANELLSSLSHINLGSISLCPGGPGATGLYERARSTVCAARDIASDPSRDGKGEPCDAVSVGIGFTAVEAKLGPVRARQFDPLGCDAGPEAYRCP